MLARRRKANKWTVLCLLVLAEACLVGTAWAYAQPSMGTWTQSLHARNLQGQAIALDSPEAVFFYDATLDLTWQRQANVYGDTQDWSSAKQWAADLVVGAWDDWRLPRLVWDGVLPCIDCWHTSTGITFGFNSPTKSGDPAHYEQGQVIYSELAHLFYVALGNLGRMTPESKERMAGWGLVNTGPFDGIATTVPGAVFIPPDLVIETTFPASYWFETGLDRMWGGQFAWTFGFFDGVQGLASRTGSLNFALAVRDGDVLTVAEPGSLPLVALGVMAGLAFCGPAAKATRQRLTVQACTSTASVRRDTQVRSPASLRRSICHTCVLRPRCTGRATPVTQPCVVALRWLALMSRPTTRCPCGTEKPAPQDPRVSASTTLTPPCRMP